MLATGGVKSPKALDRYPPDSAARKRLIGRLHAPTLWDAFLRHLAANGVAVPAADLARDVTQRVQPSQDLRPALVDVYRTKPDLADLCERLVDLDEGLMEWRYRHVKMVERTIGAKTGTGGSAGVDFLKQSLFKPLFPDLWAVRHRM